MCSNTDDLKYAFKILSLCMYICMFVTIIVQLQVDLKVSLVTRTNLQNLFFINVVRFLDIALRLANVQLRSRGGSPSAASEAMMLQACSLICRCSLFALHHANRCLYAGRSI